MNQKYEILCIFKPTTAEEKINAFTARVEKKVKDGNGEILNILKHGSKKVNTRMRKFKNFKDGIFIEIVFSSPTDVPSEITSTIRVNEDIMRFILTKALPEIAPKEEKPEEEKVEVNPEMLLGKS